MIFTPGASDIRTVDMSTLIAYTHFVFANTSSVEYDGGLPRSEHLPNWALD